MKNGIASDVRQIAEDVEKFIVQMDRRVFLLLQAESDEVRQCFGRVVNKSMQEAVVKADAALGCLLQ